MLAGNSFKITLDAPMEMGVGGFGSWNWKWGTGLPHAAGQTVHPRSQCEW